MAVTTKFKLESGIPLPSTYPFEFMAVGDSFLIPPNVGRVTVNVAARRYGDKHGMKFTVRKTPQGYRCWRVA